MEASDDLTAPPVLAEQIFGENMGGALGYARLLATTGVDHGLIGPREAPRLWERHILNCAVLAEVLEPGTVVGDIGSGAGLPGLVVAIARPDVEIHLIEPLARRTVWLDTAVAELSLPNVTVHRARAEKLAGELRCDVVTARAVARIGRLAEWAGPLLNAGGELIALKGSSAAGEIDEDRPAITRAGGIEPRIELLGEGRLDVPTTVVSIGFPRATRSAAGGPRRAHQGSSSKRRARSKSVRGSGGGSSSGSSGGSDR